MDTHLVDIFHTKSSIIYGSALTMSEHQDQNNVITLQMYKLQMLQLWIGGAPATQQEIRAAELDYLFGHRVRTIIQIDPNFVEYVDNDVPTDEEH